MKKIIFSFLLLSSSAGFACTNFTGDYRTRFMTYYSIRQDGCEKLDINDETGTREFTLDNVERKIDEYDIYADNNEVLANVQIFFTSGINGEKWITKQKDVITFKDGDQEIEERRSEAFFNDAGNLETQNFYADGTYDTDIDLKY